MLVSECITAAYREADATTVGDAPSDAEKAEALVLFNNFVLRLFGTEFGENLLDWPVPPPTGQTCVPDNLVSPNMSSTWYDTPRTNSRLLVNINAETTVKMPASPNDGSQIMIVDVGSSSVDLTLDGNGRLVSGQTSAIDTPQALNGQRYFYRADLASWELVEELDADDELPLVADWNDLFVTYLAIRLAPRNAQETTQETATVYKDLLAKARRRYRQEQPIAVNDPRVSEGLHSFSGFGARDSWFA